MPNYPSVKPLIQNEAELCFMRNGNPLKSYEAASIKRATTYAKPAQIFVGFKSPKSARPKKRPAAK